MAKILQEALSEVAPSATIVETRLANVPEIRLWLLSPNDAIRRPDDEGLKRAIKLSPYWLFCWACGLAVSRWILDNPSVVADKSVVDFGSGSGVIAIAAKLAGATSVTACDADPVARLATAENMKLNSVDLEVVGDLADRRFDVLFAGDVIYHSQNHKLLERFQSWADVSYVAESRLDALPRPGFRQISMLNATTTPNFGEPKEYSSIKLYQSHPSD